ncbi:hypothetical protein A6R68_04500 [Neotoma lepida]|uniref:Uncharacterized protein n=1 Tax=Neotoma lepida TaxID=56216 RepID=A0A1A6GM71_NEOLE|nr:hypothetical protein A6R68_04500 [Neotoma lepida]
MRSAPRVMFMGNTDLLEKDEGGTFPSWIYGLSDAMFIAVYNALSSFNRPFHPSPHPWSLLGMQIDNNSRLRGLNYPGEELSKEAQTIREPSPLATVETTHFQSHFKHTGLKFIFTT